MKSSGKKSDVSKNKSVISDLAKKLSADILSAEGLISKVKTKIHTGSTLLDFAIGGGVASGRITNIIGDSSTGKTDIALETTAYVQNVLNGVVVYCDCETTLESERASVYGVKTDEVIVSHANTVEAWCDSVIQTIEMASENPDVPFLYVLDSLDSLSDDAEMDREISTTTYAMNKAKMMSTIFRKIVGKLTESNVSLIIISQVRDNVNAGLYGQKWKVSGGRALSFYCSTRVLLKTAGKITLGANKRVVGINVRAEVIKSKLCNPCTQVLFPILFEFGIDNIGSVVDWLKTNTKFFGEKKGYYVYDDKSYRLNSLIEYIESNNLEQKIIDVVKKEWKMVNPDKVFNRKEKYLNG